MRINSNGFMLDKNQEMFLKMKELENISKNTLKNYTSLFSKMDKRINQRLDYENEDHLCDQVLTYFTAIKDHKPNTYNISVTGANCYFNYLLQRNKIKNNPLKLLGIKRRKIEFNPRPCSTNDLKQLLKVIDVTEYAGLRDYAIILLIADTGIRPSEAFGLVTNDVDFVNNTVIVRKETSKTHKERLLPVSTKVMIYIKALLKYNMDSDYVFNTINGNEMTTDRFQRRMKHYSDYSNTKITPYQLRHYFGTEYVKSDNCNILYLQKIMGHSKLEMTRRYIKIDPEDLARNHKLASPIDKLD
ncbi:site-specific integrase [Peptoniphilus sp. AGMB00490]|uniref:Site-specific integrase n=1 Tax=Peptoniphilus faecalis TaxID=2731255 RepID=A0A848RGX0_9FIRM|nr:site-specific integrase [Peptoniphilus faecalis]NMW84663.1 site-specific integrase [Peptoniphilus faecalis]